MKKEHIVAGGIGLAVLAAILIGIFVVGSPLPDAESLPPTVAAELALVETVQGRLTLSQGAITLEQELWVQMPRLLRTEVEVGPAGIGPVGPKKTTFILGETDAWFYNPSLELVTVAGRDVGLAGDTTGIGTSILQSMGSDILELLRTSQTVTVAGRETVADRTVLKVTLAGLPAENPFNAQQMTVWLDEEFSYPLALESDAGFSLRFDFVRFNAAIDPLTFVFVPPPGATIHRIKE